MSSPGRDAIRSAAAGMVSGSPLRVVDLAHLIALKLYAGGPKSTLDVIELLTRNPAADRDVIRQVCARFALSADLDALLVRLAG